VGIEDPEARRIGAAGVLPRGARIPRHHPIPEKQEEEKAVSEEPMGLPIPFGIGPIPPHIVAAMQEQKDKEEMTAEEMRQKRYAFIDGLTPDQLIQLRHIVNMKRMGLNYLDGMIATLLRVVHGVDPETGISPEAALAALADKG
jgi:hypothetical protein